MGRKCKFSQLCKRQDALKHILMVDSVESKTSCIAKGQFVPNKDYQYKILFDLILYVPSTIFQLNRDGSSRVEPVLS